MNEVQIRYLDFENAAQVETWECATNTEALFLADDVLRKGLLIEGEEVRLIPVHQILGVSFKRDQSSPPPPKRIVNELETLLMKWRTVAAEPCPAGKRCTLLPRLVQDLETLMEG